MMESPSGAAGGHKDAELMYTSSLCSSAATLDDAHQGGTAVVLVYHLVVDAHSSRHAVAISVDGWAAATRFVLIGKRPQSLL